jgi:hypothetical protein
MVDDASADGDGAGVLVLPSPCRIVSVALCGRCHCYVTGKNARGADPEDLDQKYWSVAFPMILEVKNQQQKRVPDLKARIEPGP